MEAIRDALSSVWKELESVKQNLLKRAEDGEDEKSSFFRFLLSERERLEGKEKELQLERERKEKELQLERERKEKELQLQEAINERVQQLTALFLEGKDEKDPFVRLLKEEKENFERQIVSLWGSRLGMGPAAGEGEIAFQKCAEYAEESVQLLRQLVNQERQSKGFSECSLEEAGTLLRVLEFDEENGNALYPIVVPEGTPECEVFDWSQYASETEGTTALCKHHEKQLQKLGVHFGRNGLQVFDTHAGGTHRLVLDMTLGKKSGIASANQYRGTVDAVIAPFGLYGGSAIRQLRVAYEHKQPLQQRNENRLSRGREVESSAAAKPLSVVKGQAIVETLAAYATNFFPLILDLTDGETHNLFQMRGTSLVSWEKLGPTEAYYMQSELLLDTSLSSLIINRRLKEEHLRDIPEELAMPLKKLRRYSSHCKDKLLDQLDFVQFLPEDERIAEAQEWLHSVGPFAVPESIANAVAHLYG